jgi:hypothetical protein
VSDNAPPLSKYQIPSLLQVLGKGMKVNHLDTLFLNGRHLYPSPLHSILISYTLYLCLCFSGPGFHFKGTFPFLFAFPIKKAMSSANHENKPRGKADQN